MLSRRVCFMMQIVALGRALQVLPPRSSFVLRKSFVLNAVSPPQEKATINKYSKRLTQSKSQGASQAMLYATGLKPEDMSKVFFHSSRFLQDWAPRLCIRGPSWHRLRLVRRKSLQYALARSFKGCQDWGPSSRCCWLLLQYGSDLWLHVRFAELLIICQSFSADWCFWWHKYWAHVLVHLKYRPEINTLPNKLWCVF